MDSMDLEVLKAAIEWRRAGRGCTLGTVIRTWGSAPRPVGAMMVIRDDGHVRGSISGGCIEDDLIDKLRRGTLVLRRPRLFTYGVSADEAHRFGLPCGGTLEVLLEPVGEEAGLEQLLAALQARRPVTRRLDVATGRASYDDTPVPPLSFDGETLVTRHGPRYRLLIIGAAQASRYLAAMAQALDYQVTVCDPREEYLAEWDLPAVELSRRMPDDLVIDMALDAHSAVVTLTHDPKLDDLALMEALRTPAFYVGAIGSRAHSAQRRERLALFDLAPGEIARLHGPVGLHIGARTPPEIAIAVLAEMTAIRNGVPVLQTHEHRAPPSLETADDCKAAE